MNNSHTLARHITVTALLAALALIFSYIEVLIPFQPGIPGVKLGLANLVVVIAMYKMTAKEAIMINVIRVVLAGLLFSGLWGMLYSLAGSIVSYLVMLVLKKTNLFSIIGVSLGGGVAHNLGQLIIAMLLISNARLFYYFPVLIFSGIAAGIAVGIGAFILIDRIPASVFYD